MRRIDTPDGLYHNADPIAGTPGTVVKAEPLNALQEEIISVITAAGAALDPGSTTQLRDAILAITGGGSLPWGAITDKPATYPPSPHQHAQADVVGLVDALAAKAPLASPPFTGIPTAPTPPTSTNTTQLATTAFVQQVVANVINGAPGALDTLKELADAMGDDPNFAATVTNALAGKASLTGNNTYTGVNIFYGASALFADGDNDSRFTFRVSGGRRGLISVNGLTGVGSFVVYDTDGGTPLGQLDIGAGGMKYKGMVTFTCGANDTVTVYAPGNSPAGSFVQFTSPSGNPGITAQYATTKRRDILFSNTGIQFAVSNSTAGASAQFAFGENGGFSCTGAVTASGGFQVSDRRFKYNIERRGIDDALAAQLAPLWSQWNRKSDRGFDTGLIAQDVLRIAPRYVQVPTDPDKMLAIDKSGIALECALAAEIRIQQLSARLEALENQA